MTVRQGLRFGDVQRGKANGSPIERLEQRLMVKQATTGDVDQVQAGFGAVQYVGVDDVPCGRCQRCGQYQMVGAGKSS